MSVEVLSKPAPSSDYYSDYSSESNDGDAREEADYHRPTGLFNYRIDEPTLPLDDTPQKEQEERSGDDKVNDESHPGCMGVGKGWIEGTREVYNAENSAVVGTAGDWNLVIRKQNSTSTSLNCKLVV